VSISLLQGTAGELASIKGIKATQATQKRPIGGWIRVSKTALAPNRRTVGMAFGFNGD
jgi:hypothetical protein